MGRTMLKAGLETLKGLAYADLGWIWVKATGGKPPVGTKKGTLLESVQDLFTEKAKTEGEPEVLSADCEAWLGEVGNGKPAPRKADAKEPAEKVEKPIKLKKEPKAPKPTKERDSRLPQIGAVIQKRWRDRDLEVKCLADGFEFEGRTYKSLSKIASELLGCSANGFLTFGLTAGAKAAAARRVEREAAKETEVAKPVVEAPKVEKPAKKVKAAGKSKSAKKKTTKK